MSMKPSWGFGMNTDQLAHAFFARTCDIEGDLAAALAIGNDAFEPEALLKIAQNIRDIDHTTAAYSWLTASVAGAPSFRLM
jgi:hypothetical protein